MHMPTNLKWWSLGIHTSANSVRSRAWLPATILITCCGMRLHQPCSLLSIRALALLAQMGLANHGAGELPEHFGQSNVAGTKGGAAVGDLPGIPTRRRAAHLLQRWHPRVQLRLQFPCHGLLRSCSPEQSIHGAACRICEGTTTLHGGEQSQHGLSIQKAGRAGSSKTLRHHNNPACVSFIILLYYHIRLYMVGRHLFFSVMHFCEQCVQHSAHSAVQDVIEG